MIISKELRDYMKKFQNEFGDIVPLRELPATATTEELIEAINKCLELKKNILPELFGYNEIENDSSTRS